MSRTRNSGVENQNSTRGSGVGALNGFVNRRSGVRFSPLALGSNYSDSLSKSGASGSQKDRSVRVSADTSANLGQCGEAAHVSGYSASACRAALDVVIGIGADVARAVRS